METHKPEVKKQTSIHMALIPVYFMIIILIIASIGIAVISFSK